MASTTPNIGLTLPTGAEKVSRQIINNNNTKIDTAIGTLNSKLSNYAFGTPFNLTIDNQNNYTTPMVTTVYDQVNSMGWCTFIVAGKADGSHLDQILIGKNDYAIRSNENGTWGSWVKVINNKIRYQEITITLTSSTGRTISHNAGLSGYKLISATFVQNDDLYYTCVTDGIYPIISITSNDQIQLLGMNKLMQTAANRNLKILCAYKAV